MFSPKTHFHQKTHFYKKKYIFTKKHISTKKIFFTTKKFTKNMFSPQKLSPKTYFYQKHAFTTNKKNIFTNKKKFSQKNTLSPKNQTDLNIAHDSKMVQNCPIWSRIIQNDSNFVQTIYFKNMFKIVHKGQQSMVQYGPMWSKMVQTCPEWFQTCPNLSNMVQKGPNNIYINIYNNSYQHPFLSFKV